jgi:hypothetical protein
VFKTYVAAEVLFASDLNSSITTIHNNALALISPLTGNLAVGDNDLTGIDELAFTNAAANATATGRLRRNGANLTWHNGTAAVNLNTGGTTFAGSQTTEGTTTSTTVVDIATVTGLSIVVGLPICVIFNARKSAGAANTASLGFKVNATAVDGGGVTAFSATNQAEAGVYTAYIGPRSTNYLNGWMQGFSAGTAASTLLNTSGFHHFGNGVPNATITDIIVRGFSGNAAITTAVDDVFVYTLATS